MAKYKVGDLVRINNDAEDYEVIVSETGLTHEDIGIITKFVTGHYTKTVGGKPIIHRDWYEVLFSTQQVLDFEEWEIESL